MVDALIVGAGVAGSATAIHLARMGHDVLLIDQSSFPRRKVCGEGLSPLGVRELGELIDLAAIRGSSRMLESLRFTLADVCAEATIGSPGARGLGVERERLDILLLDRAQAEGVEVQTGLQARGLIESGGRFAIETTASRLEAPIIIAADGARSLLRRSAGLEARTPGQRFGISAHLLLDEATDARIDVHFKPGYEVYITPVRERIVNVAVLLARNRIKALAGRLRDGYLDLISDVVARGPGYKLLDEPLVTGPFPAWAPKGFRHNLLLIGDSAGFFDPISGEGMALALRMARRGAEAISAFLMTGSRARFDSYDRIRLAEARVSRILARLSLALAARPSLGRQAVAHLSRHTEVFTKLVAINSGLVGLKALRPRDLLALALGI